MRRDRIVETRRQERQPLRIVHKKVDVLAQAVFEPGHQSGSAADHDVGTPKPFPSRSSKIATADASVPFQLSRVTATAGLITESLSVLVVPSALTRFTDGE